MTAGMIGPGGDLIPLSMLGVVVAGGAIAPGSFVSASQPPPPPPPGPSTRKLGLYNGAWDEGDVDLTAQQAFGHWPAIASSYYQPNQQALNLTRETTRINRGISPLISITTKGTQMLLGLAGVDAAAANTTARNWLDTYLNNLATLSRVDPNVKVLATLDHEFEVKVNQGVITGAATDFATYGKALTYFFTRARQLCPQVDVGYWTGGASNNRPSLLTTWRNITAPFDWYSSDPYAQGGTSPAASWASRNADVRSGTYATEYARLNRLAGKTIALGISETGINKAAVGDAGSATWLGNLPESMVSEDMAFCVLFNRDSGTNGDWKLNGGTNMPRPLSVAAFGQALLDVNGS